MFIERVDQFGSIREAEKYASEEGADFGLFYRKIGEDDDKWKFIEYTDRIDMQEFFPDSLDLEDYLEQTEEMLKEDLEYEEIDEEEYERYMDDLNELEKRAKKYESPVIIDNGDGIAFAQIEEKYQLSYYDLDDRREFAIGIFYPPELTY